MIRRAVLAGAAAVTAAVTMLATAPAAGAESIPRGQPWGGTTVTPPEPITATGDAAVTIEGILRNNDDIWIDLPRVDIVPLPLGEGCPAPAAARAAVQDGAFRSSRWYSAPFTFPGTMCNGTYPIVIRIDGTDRLTTTLPISRPAPTVTGVVAQEEDRAVTITWDDMRTVAPDLSGYVIERKIDDGEFEKLGDAAPDQTSVVDEDLPAGEGEASYRVLTSRPSPDGPRVSAASEAAAVPYEPAPEDPEGDGGDGGGSTGGADDDGDTGSGSSDGGSGTTSTFDPDRRASGSRFRVPAIGRSSGRVTPPLRSTTPTTLDTGYDEVLPFGEREPGDEDPVLPDDELASVIYEGDSGRGLVVPIATGLLLAVWALHLRYLVKAAK